MFQVSTKDRPHLAQLQKENPLIPLVEYDQKQRTISARGTQKDGRKIKTKKVTSKVNNTQNLSTNIHKIRPR